MKKLVIIGAGGNARELTDMLRVFPEFQVLGFLTNTRGKYDSPGRLQLAGSARCRRLRHGNRRPHRKVSGGPGIG